MDLALEFSNVAGDVADVGYGPFVDVVVPVNGADGSAGTALADGLTFVSASYLGASVAAVQLVFPDDGGGTGCVDHPLAESDTGTPLSVCGVAGDVLVVLPLPFGSFVPNQPAATIDLSLQVSTLADLGVALPLRRRAGFRFGADPLDNACCDPSLVSATGTDSSTWPSTAITPELLSVRKEYLGPEDETSSGPNFPQMYRLVLDLAAGQSLTDVDVRDLLPESLAYLRVVSTTPAASVVAEPAVGVASAAPGNELHVNFSAISGTTSSNDAEVVLEFFVPRIDAAASDVVPASSGDDTTAGNHVQAVGDWTPLDGRDPGGADNVTFDGSGPEHTLSQQSISIQKSVAIVQDSGAAGATPGDVLEYTLEVQVSDFFVVGGVAVTDVLSDGQAFDGGFVPTLAVTEHGVTSSGAFDAANYSVDADKTPMSGAPNTGLTTLVFDLSSELTLRGADGLLLGGCVPASGTGGPAPDCSTSDLGATTATVVFRAVIAESFSDDYPSGDASVDQGDRLTNSAVVDSTLHSVADLTVTGATEADDTAASVDIAFGQVSKSIYAINGNLGFSQPVEISPGDEITYRLEVSMPTADFENLVVSDFLPLPVFAATEVTQLLAQADSSVPAAGTLKFGPTDTLLALAGAPSFSTQAQANSVVLDFGDFDAPSSTATKIDVLFTVTVSDEPFADDLLLTNQLHLEQASTNGGVHVADAIVQFRLRQPLLRFSKGVVGADNAAASFEPADVGPSLAGTVTSDDLATSPIGSDVSGIDAGDVISFALVLENLGGSGAFDIVLDDVLPPGLQVPAGGLNLSVRRGDGTVLSVSPLGPSFTDEDLFGNGLEIVDPSGEPACQEYAPTTGSNLVLVTYDLEVVSAEAVPAALHANDAGLTQYGGDEGSGAVANHVFASTQFRDTASVTVASPLLTKSILSTSESHTPESDPGRPLAVGETATYRVVVRVPEGTSPGVSFVDQVTPGLQILSIDSVSASPGLSTSHAGGFAGVRADAAIAGNGLTVTLPFDDVTNANRDNATDDTLTVDYTVRVVDDVNATSGTAAANDVSWDWTGGQVGAAAPQALIVEPSLDFDKSVTPGNGDAGDTVSFTLTVTHSGASSADAFDLHLTDALSDPDLALVNGSVVALGGSVVRGNGGEGDVEVCYDSLALGATATVTFDAVLLNTVVAGDVLTNVADLSWDSLPDETGERSYGPISAGAQITVGIPGLSKTVLSTSEASTGSSRYSPTIDDLTLGEEATFRIVATLPEGVTSQVVLIDSMPASANGVLGAVSATVVSVGGSLTPATPAPTPSITDANLGDGIDDRVELDFGQVINAPDGVVNSGDQIVVDVLARVVDVAANQGSRTVTNTVLIDFAGALQPTATAQVEFVEPLLTVDKSGDETTGDAGDTVRFTLEVQHDAGSSARAFDVELTDAIPAGMTFAGNLQSTGTAPPDSLAESSGTVTASWDELDVGEVGRVVFDVTVDVGVNPGQSLTNQGALAWDSLPSDASPPGERSGSTSDEHLFTVTLPGVDKTIFSTSESSTGTAINGPETDVTIGEQVTYRVVVTLPEGTIGNASIVDQLPKGSAVLDLESATVVRVGSALSGPGVPTVGAAGAASDTDLDGFDDRVEWVLGTVTNAPDGMETAADEIEVEVVARVVDVAANSAGDDDVTNVATLDHASGTAMDSALVDIVDPLLELDKSASSVLVDAGDVVQFDLQISHATASNADAFSLVIVDALPSSGLSWVGNGTVTSDCADIAVDSNSLPTVQFDVSTLSLAGGSCTISYDLQVDGTVQPAQSYDNTATLQYDSQPTFVTGETRRRTTSDMETVTILAPGLVKITDMTSLTDTGSSQFGPGRVDLAIGEQVDYQLTVVFPEGVTEDAVVTDLMPSNVATGFIEVIGASVSTIGSQLVATGPGTPVLSDSQVVDGLNDTVVFDFGQVTNTPDGENDAGDRIVLTVTGLVVNQPDNAAGDVLSNYAELDFATGGPLSDTADVDIVEPNLELGKTMGPMAAHSVPVSLSVENTGTAPAYEVRMEDVLTDALWDLTTFAPVTTPTGFILEALDEGSQLRVVLRADPGSASPNNSIEPGETVSADFSIQALKGPSAPTSLPNSATESGATSLPGTDANEREQPDRTVNANLAVPVLDVTKAAAIAADADSSGTLSPGDTLRYTVVLSNSGTGSATSVVFDDTPDANTTLITGSVQATGAGVVVVGNGGGDGVVQITYAQIDGGVSETLTFDVLIGSPLGSGVEVVSNQGVVTTSELDPVLTDDPSSGVVDDPTISPVDAAPDLLLTKTDNGAGSGPGGLIFYLLDFDNVGNQTATGVVLTETVPDNTTYNATMSGNIWSCPDGSTAGTTCSLNLGTRAVGQSGQVTFALTVSSPLPPGVSDISNTAVISDDGANGADPDVANNVATDSTPLSASPVLSLTKDDGGATAVYGTPVVYSLDYTNGGNQTATGVVLTETVPANTTFNASASLPSLWSCADGSPAGTECTLSLGTLSVGVSGTAVFAVDVDPATPEGTVLNNVASIVDDGSGASGSPAGDSDGDTTPVRAPRVTKSLLSGSTATIGQEVSYRIEILVPEGASTPAVVLTDTLPAGLLAVRQDAVSVGAGLAMSGSTTPVIEDDSFVWSLGTVTNSDGDSGTDELLTFDITVQVRNDVTTVEGATLSNDVTLAFGGQSRSGSADVTVVEPRLLLDKSFDQTSAGGSETVTVRLQLFHDAASSAAAHDIVLSDVLDDDLTWLGNVVSVNGPAPVVDVSALPEVRFTLGSLDLSYDDANRWEMTFEVTTAALLDQSQRVDNLAEVRWTSISGDPGLASGSDPGSGERTGDDGDPGGSLNDYVAESSAQLNNGVRYTFEDLKNDATLANDFDYNDLVLDVAITEQVNAQGEWTEIELWIDARARGAGFVHNPFLDVGIGGPVNLTIDYYDTAGAFLFTDTSSSDDDFVKSIPIFFDSWFALPAWNSGSFTFAANTDPAQLSGNQTSGARTRVVIEVLDPSSNPRRDDDAQTLHLNETINHLLGPWISVIDTGEMIYQRWRHRGATQDLVTAELYGPTTPLLGFPLDQATNFSSAWRWPVEREAIWDAYPDFVDFTYAGGTAFTDWKDSPAANLTWPVDSGSAASLPMLRSRVVTLPSGSFAFTHAFTTPVNSSPAIGDLDGDGEYEVVVGAFLNQIVVHDADGSVDRVIDPSPGQSVLSVSSVVLADLDGDGTDEILRGYDDGVVRAYDADGSLVRQFSVGGTVKSTPAVADADGDQSPEVFVLGGDTLLYGFAADGTSLSGFPVVVGGQPDVSNNLVILPSPVIADVDGVGAAEIVVVANSGEVCVFSLSGQRLGGWPVDLEETVLSSPVVANLDGLGGPEIVVADDQGGVTALRSDGSIAWTRQRVLGGPSSPAAGDLDGDGTLEIVVGSLDGKVYAYDAAGSDHSGWPVSTTSAVQSSPALADVDGDGDVEVFIGSFDTRLYGLAGDGSALMTSDGGTFPVALGAVLFSSPAVADLQGDGEPEVVIGSYDRSLYAVEAAGSVRPLATLWPQFRGGAGNGGQGQTGYVPLADLGVSKDDGLTSVAAGSPVSYAITVSNSGPDAVLGARVVDTLPAELQSATWTCTSGLGACGTANGSGNIDAQVDLPVGANAVFQLDATVDPAATGTLVNVASVTPPAGVADLSVGNDSNSDLTTIQRVADVSATISGQSFYSGGAALTHTVTFANAGPSDAPGSSIGVSLPVELQGPTWTCSGTGGGACAASGSGAPTGTVDLPAGGSVSFVIGSTAASGANTTLSIQASVAAGGGATDPDSANDADVFQLTFGAPGEAPTVTAVLDLESQLEIETCRPRLGAVTGLEIEFSEAMRNLGGQTAVGDLDNPLSYLLVRAGADSDLSTTSCTAASGDDLPVGWQQVTAWSGDDGVSLSPEGAKLVAGAYRLLVCADVANADGVLLDGDGDGFGGDGYSFDFRVDEGNLLSNAHFDCDVQDWTLDASDPAEIVHESQRDVDSASISGSAAVLDLSGSPSYALSQCVPVAGEESLFFRTAVETDAPGGVVADLSLGCRVYASVDCSGNPLRTDVQTLQVSDSASVWSDVVSVLSSDSAAQSARCELTVEPAQGFGFEVYLDQVHLQQGIFSNGFESGGTAGWASSKGEN